MKPANRRQVGLGLVTLLAFGALAAVGQDAAHAQATPDPDYWKQTAERRNTVYRFVYSQSPQTIPTSYDAVAEAERITLREAQRTLPPSDPQARSIGSAFAP